MNRTLIKKLILILLGNFILAFGVNCFMVSTGIIMGGATGIGLAVNKFTGINLSYVVWVLNFIPVSYTHLDVYKRHLQLRGGLCLQRNAGCT